MGRIKRDKTKFYKTAVYGHPVTKCKGQDKYKYETKRGVNAVKQKLKASWKLFSNQKGNGKYQTTSRERIIFVGHTWQLRKNYKSTLCVCRDSPNLKSVILLSCSSGEKYSILSGKSYKSVCKKLSSDLFKEEKTGIEVIGFIGDARARYLEREEICNIDMKKERSIIEFTSNKVVKFVDGEILTP